MYLILILIGSITFIVLATTRFKIHPFLALLIASLLYGIFAGITPIEVVKIINKGFGDTLGQIGLIILLGSMIGKFLEKTGGAFLIAEKLLKLTGQKMVSLSMSFAGYLVSIPVFADSGFIILSSLKKTLANKAGISVIAPTIALSSGLMASHAMLPPTPGPVAAAGILNADIGLIILLGLPVSLFGALCAWQFAERFAKNKKLSNTSIKESLEENVNEPVSENVGLGWAVLPIFVPIVLIVLKSIAQLPDAPFGDSLFKEIALFVGEPFIALSIGFLFALKLPKNFKVEMWSTKGWLGEALLEAAIILLITGAGGAFGKVLQQSPLTEIISGNLVFDNWGIWLPFIIAAALKSAQGSSTVAIITTASLVAPLLPALGLDASFGLALTVLAIGAGSVVVSHANDSFFWVVTQLSGMNITEGYKYHSTGSAILGCTAMLMVFIISKLIL